jgi:hypothetical protein
MKLVNNLRARLLLYWCPACQRFAEQHKHQRRSQTRA